MPLSRVPAATLTLALGGALGAAGAAPPAEESLPRGRLVEAVACRADRTKSYALYLPSAYDASRAWPVVFALDPVARGKVAVERFRAGAEAHGFVIAGSNDSRNGPVEPSVRAVAAMIDDARSRLRLDERRVYLAGFSGGARVASVLAGLPAVSAAGVVACGAGLAQGIEPESLRPAFYLGIVGVLDFNYVEMRDLDRVLREKDVAHRLVLTGERHGWPPPDVCARALGWLELVAMAAGTRARDEAVIGAVLGVEEEAASALAREGDLDRAALAYEGIEPVARALLPASPVPARLEALRREKDLARQRKEEDARARAEKDGLARFGRVLARLRDAPTSAVDFARTLDDLGIDRLARTGKAAATSKDGQLSARLLAALASQSRTLGRTSLDAGDAARAGLYFETAIAASALDPGFQNDTRVWLACARARAGDSRGALELLREAAAAGFDDREFLESVPALSGLRGMPEFQEILRSVPVAAPGP